MANLARRLTGTLESSRVWAMLSALVLVWAGIAYAALPFVWRHYERQRGLARAEMVTRTPQGIPGDPVNVGFVGSQGDVLCAFQAAGWAPADPVTLASSLKIVGSVVLDRAYPDAPVSPLLLNGRREDLAFQKPSGSSPDTRHHVRLWTVLASGEEGRPVWLGAASFDKGVGVSHYTLQVTHHIDADVDAERDLLATDIANAGIVEKVYDVGGVGPTLDARNGGGDRYYTDGEVRISVLSPDCVRRAGAAPRALPNPPAVEMKDGLWRAIRRLF